MQVTQATFTQSSNSSTYFRPGFSPIAPGSSFMAPLTLAQSHNLQAARQALLTSDKPHLLKVISYLRISCSVMRHYRQGLLANAAPLPGLTFSSLMQALYAHHPEWWNHCQVTIAGRLTSDDAVICQLLQPVDAFHQLQG